MQDPAFAFDHAGHMIEMKLNGEWWDGEIRDAADVLVDAFSYIHEGDYPGDLRAALKYRDRDGLIRELWLQVWKHERQLGEPPSVSIELSGDVVTVRRYYPDNLWVGEIRKALVRYVHAPRRTDARVETAAFAEASRGMLAVKLWDAVTAQDLSARAAV